MTRCPTCQGTRIDPTTGGECVCPVPAITASPAWTAGPWRVGADLIGICIAWPGEEDSLSPECFSRNGYAKTVAKVTHAPWAGIAEHVANARLIAAAPDLAEALASLVGLARMRGPDHLHEYGALLDLADAALAKARGQ